MVSYTPDEIASVDCGYWAELKRIRLQAGLFTFNGFEYQSEPMSSQAKRICYLKARQCFGATTNEVLKDLHGMIYRKYKLGVAHIFPTTDEVGEFSKSIFKPLIASNKISIGKFVKNVSGGTDTTNLKNVNGAMLFLRGARLSQKVGDSSENTSSKTAGFSADKCVFDEVDFMDSESISKYLQSMGMSPWQHEVYLGNPSHEDFGIDLIFKQSDQRYWFRKCGCGHWTCAEKSFPQCVKIRSDGTGYIGCDKCGKEVPVWAGEGTGEWVPDYPDRSNYMHGYMASQMMTPFNDPAQILEDFINPPYGDLASVYRLRLGRPYSGKNDKLRKSEVLACCSNEGIDLSHSGPCAMGVDVGKKKHIVIGIKIDSNRFEILRAIVIPEGPDGWNQISDYAKKYNVKSTVIDIGPYFDEARSYQRSHGPSATNPATYLCQYSDTQLSDAEFNNTTGVVKVNRTEMFDQTHRLLSNGKMVLPRQCPEIEEFARQCCNCARFEEDDKRTHTKVVRYRPTGDRQEHFRNALNYFVLAASGHRVSIVNPYKKTNQLEVITDYQRV